MVVTAAFVRHVVSRSHTEIWLISVGLPVLKPCFLTECFGSERKVLEALGKCFKLQLPGERTGTGHGLVPDTSRKCNRIAAAAEGTL